ncbi:MAG: metallopeptidase family protein [Actinomycetota bacterium]
MVSEERFEELAAEALDGLPAWVLDIMDNVQVVVEEDPPSGQPGLLGLYHGVPLLNRGFHYSGVMPDRITLYRRVIEAVAGPDEERLRRVVAHTVAHEVAHHLGITDERLLEIDAY